MELRKDRLFVSLEKCVRNGANPARVCDIDRYVDQKSAAFVIKHDIHAMNLDSLIDFAQQESNMNIFGSYFFMAPNHPHTIQSYDFSQQVKAMRAVSKMGHEVGLHIDPYFLMHWKKASLADLLGQILDEFNKNGIKVISANIHGNSKFKMLDKYGYGTSFDLFEEISRQGDFPKLADVDSITADLIRHQRIRIRDFGITHWADMPLYSERYGLIVTNFISDNRLGKQGTIEIFLQNDAVGQYKLCEHQPPGYRSPCGGREILLLPNACRTPSLAFGSHHCKLEDETTMQTLVEVSVHPSLFLIHPQHYC